MVGESPLTRTRRILAVVCIAGLSLGLGVLLGLVLADRNGPPNPGLRRSDPLKTPAAAYDWTAQPEPAFPIPPYAVHLQDVVIVLDPGHGGRKHRKNWKRGPTGLREAEVNLRVAHFLRDFLTEAGARVLLTRETDCYLDEDNSRDLSMRIALANELRADLFLSIHHNAAELGSPANYSSIFYHGAPHDSLASIDAAWCILAGLNDALRLPQHLPCGVISDYTIFPDKGFRVLREAKVPAVLSEASFHSNPEEEQRLRDRAYNRREAYGLFLGLARWAQAGLPKISLPDLDPYDDDGRLIVRLDDGLTRRRGFGMNLPQIDHASIVVADTEGLLLPFILADDLQSLKITPTRDMLQYGAWLYVDFTNASDHNVLHPWLNVPPRADR